MSSEEQSVKYQPRPVRALAAGAISPGDTGISFKDEAYVACYPAVIDAGNLSVDLDVYRARIDGNDACLSCQEFDLLVFLVLQRGRVFSFPDVTKWLWKSTGRAYEARLRVVARKLQSKLSLSNPYEVRLVAAKGYTFARRSFPLSHLLLDDHE